ncbi:MFS transporter [Actinorhabdospora filicis]|uniref:MFS transporter n=1 Tax=Actinorhabdospora filicis TaxID=1785913 RepID=A0A9W6SIG3_9ACTN|nr:MFS transporter [Actinorhabdospora filicis]GLZ76603.1 MFS transporter [Actinorhabdospora filicis]
MTATIAPKTGTPLPAEGADTPPGIPDRWPARLWLMLITLCVVLFLDGLDGSMVGVALPSIGAELGMTTSSLQWIVSGFVLGYGGLLLLGGRTADLIGRRKVFIIALAVFAVASLLGGLVDSGPLLIATRFIKGVSAAFTAPTGLSIITTTFPEGKARNRALSLYTVFGASGYSFGLIVGGLLTDVGWRWTFLLPVPVALLTLVGAVLLIPKDKPAAEGGHDILGALFSTLGMLLLVYTVVTAPEVGWGSPRTIGSFAGVAALFTAFVITELKVKHPLIRLSILKKGSLLRANFAFIALMGSYMTFQFMVSLYLQDSLHWSSLELALSLFPAGLLVAVSAPFAGNLIDRFGTPKLVIGGLLALTIGYVLFLRLDTNPSYFAFILPSVLLLGVGFALGFPAINVQATNGIHDDEQGLAAGLVQTAGQVGIALILAINTAIIATDIEHPTPEQTLDAFKPGLYFVTAVALVGLLITLTGLVKRKHGRHEARS